MLSPFSLLLLALALGTTPLSSLASPAALFKSSAATARSSVPNLKELIKSRQISSRDVVRRQKGNGWARRALPSGGVCPAVGENVVSNSGFQTNALAPWTLAGDLTNSLTENGICDGIDPDTQEETICQAWAVQGDKAGSLSFSQTISVCPGQPHSLLIRLGRGGGTGVTEDIPECTVEGTVGYGTIFTLSPCQAGANACDQTTKDGLEMYKTTQYNKKNSAVSIPESSTGTETLTITFTCSEATPYTYYLDETTFQRIGGTTQQR